MSENVGIQLQRLTESSPVLVIGEVVATQDDKGCYSVEDGFTGIRMRATTLGPPGDGSLVSAPFTVGDEVLLALTDGFENPIILGCLYNPLRIWPGLHGQGLSILHPAGVVVAKEPTVDAKAVVHGQLPQDLKDGWGSLKGSLQASPGAISGAISATQALAATAATPLPVPAPTPTPGAGVANKAYIDAVVAAVNGRFTEIAASMATLESKLSDFEQYISNSLKAE